MILFVYPKTAPEEARYVCHSGRRLITAQMPGNYTDNEIGLSVGSGTVRIRSGGGVWLVGELANDIPWYSRRPDVVGLLSRNTSIQRLFFHIDFLLHEKLYENT